MYGEAVDAPEKWNVAFDRQIIQWCREQVDAHAANPYDEVTFYINWLWLSQVVSAMEKGLE